MQDVSQPTNNSNIIRTMLSVTFQQQVGTNFQRQESSKQSMHRTNRLEEKNQKQGGKGATIYIDDIYTYILIDEDIFRTLDLNIFFYGDHLLDNWLHLVPNTLYIFSA